MFKKFINFFYYCIIIIIFTNTQPVYALTINDYVNIEDTSKNLQLIGYGLVVGLNNTGDSKNNNPFTVQSLDNMFRKLGLHVKNYQKINSKNTALVIINAHIPSYSYIGQKIDVSVSSIGDAKSLFGGTLLMSPLYSAEGKIYAIAQGDISLKKKKNIANKKNVILHNNAIIKKGAIIEQYTNNEFDEQETIKISLIHPDVILVQIISDLINNKYPDTAIPVNSRTIILNINQNSILRVKILSKILKIKVKKDKKL